MTDVVKLRDEVKKFIRALLLSTPIGLTTSQLDSDYYAYVGKHLPYRQMGYSSVEDMIKDMRDVVAVTWQGGQMVLKAVADETTKRIERMVSRQKLSKQNERENVRRRQGHHISSSRDRRHSQRRRPSPDPHVPAFLRTHIMTLLKAYPKGLRMTCFEQAYARRFGGGVPWKQFCFPGLYDLLQFLHSRCVITLDRMRDGDFNIGTYSGVIPASRTRHPSGGADRSYTAAGHEVNYNREQSYSAVAHQTNNASSATRGPSENILCDRRQQQSQNTGPPLMNLPSTRAGPVCTPVIRAIQQFPPVPDGRVGQADRQEVLRPPSPLDQPAYVDDDDNDSVCSFDSMEADFDDDDAINANLKSEIQELLAKKTDGIPASKLAMEYKKEYGKDLEWKELGYLNVIGFVAAMQDICRFQRRNMGDWYLFDARIPEKAPETTQRTSADIEQAERSQNKFNDEFKEEIRQVLLGHKDGVLLNELPEVYEKAKGKQLEVKDLGFPSLEAMLLSLMDKYLHMQYKGEGRLLVFAIEFPSDSFPVVTSSKAVPEPHAPPRSVGEFPLVVSPAMCNVPDDSVGLGACYSQISVMHLDPSISQDYVTVSVTNIVSPGRFWLHLVGKETTVELNRLMNRLERVYKHDRDQNERYRMPESIICVGQVCAVLFAEDGNWHRGVITAIKDLDYVEVYYVDYGNTCKVPKSSVRLLKSRFLQLPVQAIQARLAHLKPLIKEGWKLSARNRMLQMVCNRSVFALVTDVKINVLSVCLIDTHTKDDIHINDQLVHEGHAVCSIDDDDQTLDPNPTTSKIRQKSSHRELRDRSRMSAFLLRKDIPNGIRTSLNIPSYEIPDLHASYGLAPVAPPVDGRSRSESVEKDPLEPKCVQPVRLTEEYVVHVINFEDKPYMVSSEISSFFWESDLLRSKLRQKKLLHLGHIVISKHDHLPLFEELQSHKVKGIMDGEDVRAYLSLYELVGVPVILEKLQHWSLDLKSGIDGLIESFNPDDVYWKGGVGQRLSPVPPDENPSDLPERPSSALSADYRPERPPSALSSDNDAELSQLDIDELRLTLHTLQFRRKRLLQQINCSYQANTEERDVVDELNDVEVEMEKVRQKISQLETEGQGDEATPREPLKLPPNLPQMKVEECMEETEAVAETTSQATKSVAVNKQVVQDPQVTPSKSKSLPVQIVIPTMSKMEPQQNPGPTLQYTDPMSRNSTCSTTTATTSQPSYAIPATMDNTGFPAAAAAHASYLPLPGGLQGFLGAGLRMPGYATLQGSQAPGLPQAVPGVAMAGQTCMDMCNSNMLELQHQLYIESLLLSQNSLLGLGLGAGLLPGVAPGLPQVANPYRAPLGVFQQQQHRPAQQQMPMQQPQMPTQQPQMSIQQTLLQPQATQPQQMQAQFQPLQQQQPQAIPQLSQFTLLSQTGTLPQPSPGLLSQTGFMPQLGRGRGQLITTDTGLLSDLLPLLRLGQGRGQPQPPS